MRLFFILFFNISLFALNQTEICTEEIVFDSHLGYDVGPVSYYDTFNRNGTNYWFGCGTSDIRYYTYTQVSSVVGNETYTYTIDYYKPLASTCVLPSVWDNVLQFCVNPTPICTDSQFLDSNNTCQPLSLPNGFPDDTAGKGTSQIRAISSVPEPDCIAGKKVHSPIAYAQYLGFNKTTQKCQVATFFCHSGLTWDNVQFKCVIPPDEKVFSPDDSADPQDGTISSALAGACSSGKWSKSWTLDYCGNPTCYIGLSSQGYNLQCDRKYIEYDCTSDYRIKKFVQASCGDIAQADYKQHTLDGGNSNNNVADTSTPSSTSDVVSKINEGTNKTNNLLISVKDILTGEKKFLNDINTKLSDTNNLMISVKDTLTNQSHTLDSIDRSLKPTAEDIQGAKDGFLDGNLESEGILSDALSTVSSTLDGISNDYDGMYTKVQNGFSISPTNKGNHPVFETQVFGGHTFKISLCNSFSQFYPIFFYMFVISFTFFSVRLFVFSFMLRG